MHDGSVDPCGKVILPFPIGKRKDHLPDGAASRLAKGQAHADPWLICSDQFLKPLFQNLKGQLFIEIPHITRRLTAVGHADPDPVKAFPAGIHIGIAAGLGQMDIHRPFHTPESTEHCLDLIDRPKRGRRLFDPRIRISRFFRISHIFCTFRIFHAKNTVRASLQPQDSLPHGHIHAERDLRLIAFTLFFLKSAVDPRTLQHGRLGRRTRLRIQRPPAQEKLYERTYRYPNDVFFLLH